MTIELKGAGASRAAALAAWMALTVGVASCSEMRAPPLATTGAYGKPVMLGINGFNYTDLYIDSFSVNGAGGGNLFVSSPTSGGDGTMCCVVWVPGQPLPQPVHVEWVRWLDAHHAMTCHKTVLLNGPIPDNPTAFSVHFMPEGDVEVEVTHGEGDPKLKLSRFNSGHRRATGNVTHDREKAECTVTEQ